MRNSIIYNLYVDVVFSAFCVVLKREVSFMRVMNGLIIMPAAGVLTQLNKLLFVAKFKITRPTSNCTFSLIYLNSTLQ